MAADLVIKRNDLTPVALMVAADDVGPVDLTGATAIFRMVNVLTGATKVSEPASIAAVITFTAAGATLTATGHGLNNGEQVTLKSTGALPGGFSASQVYYVVNATANTLQLSLIKGGTAITTTNAGSGTHSLLSGRVVYEWQTGDTDESGTYVAEIQTTLGGKQLTYPNNRNFVIEVISDLG